MGEASPAGTRGEYQKTPAEKYYVKVQMEAGPFKVDNDYRSELKTADLPKR